MFNILVPKNHFLAVDYPDMEEYILGLPIPVGWGNIHDVVPFCVDVGDLRFKIVDQHIQEITEVRSKGIPLSAGSYTENLVVAEFTLKGTPYIVEGYTYYFSVSADYGINPTDHVNLMETRKGGDVQGYTIDGADLWTPIVNRQIAFEIYGKERLSEEEKFILIRHGFTPSSPLALSDDAARTRIGCSFVAPPPVRGRGYYVTRILVWYQAPTGTPVGNLFAIVFYGINPDLQQGIQGDAVEISNEALTTGLTFPQDAEESDVVADIQSPYPMLISGADILEDLFVSILKKSAALLEPVALANFAAKRVQEMKVLVDRETTVGEFIGKMEASLLWKFLPLQDGTYGTIVFEAGEPAGTPHFRDEDFLSFRVEHDLSVVRNIVRVKYDEDPSTQEFKVEEARSDYARLFYSNEETVEVETWLKQDLDALDLAEDYSFFFQEPQVRIIFEVHGAGLNLLPGRDKVVITRARAAWPGGAINGELFRIMKIVKRPGTNTAEITAVPDDRSYAPPDVVSGSGSGSGGGFAYGLDLFFTNGFSQNICGVSLADFATDGIYVPGGGGSGHGKFSQAHQIAVDDTYIWVADGSNSRVQKFLKADGSFIAHTAPGVLGQPWGCVLWGDKLYVSCFAPYTWNKIVILDADTLAKVGEFGSAGSGDDEFNGPRGMSTDGEHLYICDTGNVRIKKHTMAGTFVKEVGSPGAGNLQFGGSSPCACACDGIYLFVCDYGNLRVQKLLASDLSYVSEVAAVTGSPASITIDEDCYYIANNEFYGNIEKRDKVTDALIDIYNPSSIVGNQVSTLWGAFISKKAA